MSLDSDIQFLGNWSSKAPASAATWVSAIVLTPVKSEDAAPEAPLTFSREATSVVHVGRNNNINEVASHSADRAVFTSPVMSRSHAKITFSDSGSVFIIDTGSYHGTWVARASEPEKFKLNAEDSLQLQDGDILTFGKEVIKDDKLHKPVTLSVKLLHSSQPSVASPMSISPPEFGVPSPKPSRNTFGLQTTTDEDGSCDDSHDEESDYDEFQETSMSPSIPPGQMEAFGSSISTGDDSSSSEADNEPEPLIPDAVPTSSSPLAPLTPPWHRLPSIFSGSLGRLGSPNKSPRTPSTAGRFERFIFGRSSGGGSDDILSSEARVSEVAHEDLGRMSYSATHHHLGHHHNHHCHSPHHHHTHEQVTVSHNCTTAADVSKLSERIDELVKDVQTVKENSEGLNTLRDTVNAADEKLEDSLAPLKVDIMMLQSHKNAVQMDIKFLRADLEARGVNVETVRDELEKRVHDVREQAVEIQASLESVQDDLVSMKEENLEMSSDISNVRVDVEALEVKVMELRGALEDIEAFRAHSENAMKDIRMETEKTYEEMSEKIKSEVKQMLEEYRESTVTQITQVLGKRKRSDDDEGSPEEPNDLDVEGVKPCVGTTNKRARLVTRLVTAGAIGAVGAWLGLAYL